MYHEWTSIENSSEISSVHNLFTGGSSPWRLRDEIRISDRRLGPRHHQSARRGGFARLAQSFFQTIGFSCFEHTWRQALMELHGTSPFDAKWTLTSDLRKGGWDSKNDPRSGDTGESLCVCFFWQHVYETLVPRRNCSTAAMLVAILLRMSSLDFGVRASASNLTKLLIHPIPSYTIWWCLGLFLAPQLAARFCHVELLSLRPPGI